MGTMNSNCGGYCEKLFPLRGNTAFHSSVPGEKTVKTQIHSVSQFQREREPCEKPYQHPASARTEIEAGNEE